MRSAGLLLHPTSLPGRFDVGDLGPAASRFLEWASSAGQRLWQVLPLSPSGHHGSPYGGLSSFAGNPLVVSPERLVEEGLLSRAALPERSSGSQRPVDFASAEKEKERLLRESFDLVRRSGSEQLRADFEEFRRAPEQSWLADWSLYAALRARLARPWFEWEADLARRRPAALESARRELASEIEYAQYVQFLFARQWRRLRGEAKSLGIRIVGDLPIYVTLDAADVWVHPELFELDDRGRPTRVAGVPPDYFSATGQLWGYPLYRWDRMREDGFAWWIERIGAMLRIADVVRIDHFRGLASFWAVPASESTAIRGEWLPGPGLALFARIREVFGEVDIVAEDLGIITPDVRELLAQTRVPGMRVLQFAFSEPDSEHLPHRHVPRSVVYTGTHDNDTVRGWFASASAEEKRRALDYLGGSERTIEWDMIRAAFTSVAERAIVPVQDVFGLGSEARMNDPAEAEGNWKWRAREEDFTPERSEKLRRLAEVTARAAEEIS